MTELSRFQKDVEVAATALEMRAENEDAKEEAIHLYRKFGSTKQEPLRLAVALRGYFLEEGVEEEERAHYGAYLKKRIRPAVERLILEDDWEKIEKLYENEWFGEQELEVFLKLAEEFIVIRIIVALRESDIKPHKESFAVTVAHVGHDLIDLLQYRFFTSKLFGFIRHDGMSLVLVFVGDSFVSHVAVFLLLTVYSVFLSVGMSLR